MKKLNLQLGSIKEMLTKEQMKKVAGGYGGIGGSCPRGYYLCECWCFADCLPNGWACHTCVNGGQDWECGPCSSC